MDYTFLRKEQTITHHSSAFETDFIPNFKENHRNLKIKRCMDILISVLLLVFIGVWLFPLLGTIIKMTSPGPVFFKQLRHGKNNIPFYCFKFRTMVINQSADVLQAKKDDERITKIGRILRRSSLDELPQLINVLLGEMSIIGPRPHAVPMNEVFTKVFPIYMVRHTMKPGITGLAQSKGYRGEIINYHDLHSRFRLDIFYIKNWCLYFDLKILVWTAFTLLFRNDKAY
jgi:putative colanic acid biosynthesis UDP-glucose lipid carrier transferase